jgi:hypothetical protein
MALLGNHSVLHKLPLRFFGGSTTSVEVQLQSNFNKSGSVRNRFLQDGTTTGNKIYSLPEGSYAGVAWILPQSNGAMAAHNSAKISVGTSGVAWMGLPATGSTSISVSTNTPWILPLDDSSPLRTASAAFSITADATAQLISSGSGTAVFSIVPNAPVLTASVNCIGSATYSFSANALLGALASGTGSSSIAFTSSATMFPTNDASPLRSGSATITFGGSLTPYAIGIMNGSTVDNSVLTRDSIAQAVWAAIAADNTGVGTMGSKLNTASSGGVDISAVVDSVLAALNATTIPVNIKKVNSVAITGTGQTTDSWRPA